MTAREFIVLETAEGSRIAVPVASITAVSEEKGHVYVQVSHELYIDVKASASIQLPRTRFRVNCTFEELLTALNDVLEATS